MPALCVHAVCGTYNLLSPDALNCGCVCVNTCASAAVVPMEAGGSAASIMPSADELKAMMASLQELEVLYAKLKSQGKVSFCPCVVGGSVFVCRFVCVCVFVRVCMFLCCSKTSDVSTRHDSVCPIRALCAPHPCPLRSLVINYLMRMRTHSLDIRTSCDVM